MARIFIIDAWNGKFTRPMFDYWTRKGHEVRTDIYWGPQFVEWADICWFYPVQNNLIQASRKQEKPEDTLIIAEAVDVDIYAAHPGAVNWDFVDHLVFMADHMRDYALGRFKKLRRFPQDHIHVIPGGLDLDRWTLRADRPKGYNVAFVGRLWIAKNVFGAVQIFNQLIKTDPDHPWRLFIRGEKYHPEQWWQRQVESYIELDPDLKSRVTFVPQQKSMNEWLENMDFLLQTSFKEAFGYVIAEALAKGIRPVIQTTTGAEKIWPSFWVFRTHDEAVRMFLENGDSPADRRAWIEEVYPLSGRVRMFEEICGLR